jgi:hypothetical protein
MYLGLLRNNGQSRSQQTQSRRIATPCFEGFFRVSIMLPRSHLAIWAVYVYSLLRIARTEAFLMASNAFIVDVLRLNSMLMISLLSHTASEYLVAVASISGARAAPGLFFI